MATSVRAVAATRTCAIRRTAHAPRGPADCLYAAAKTAGAWVGSHERMPCLLRAPAAAATAAPQIDAPSSSQPAKDAAAHGLAMSLVVVEQTPAGVRASAPTKEVLGTYKVAELQALLSSLALTKSGKKAELVDRLHAALVERVLALEALGTPLRAAAPYTEVSRTEAAPEVKRGMTLSVGNGDAPSVASVMQATGRVSGAAGVAAASSGGNPALQPLASSLLASVPAARRQREAQATSQASDVQSTPGGVAGQHTARAAPAAPAAPAASAEPHLPDWPRTRRGVSWPLHERDLTPEQQYELVMTNASDLQLVVLGSAAGAPAARRGLGSLALLRSKDVWLVDAGDDTQRQLGCVPHVKPSKVFRVLLTSLSPDCVLGLTGLLCTCNASRTRGHETADIPIHVYGPPGTAQYLASIFKVSNTYMEVNVVVYEFTTGPVPEELVTPVMFNRRARIFRALVPPDQLNPNGGSDGSLETFMPTQGRATVQRGAKARGGVLSHDMRAGFLPFPGLVPGNPRASVRVEDMQWTVEADVGARLVVVALPGTPAAGQEQHGAAPSFAYVFQEAERTGAMVVERAHALNVRPGADFSTLKSGTSVTSLDGRTVHPHEVLTPNRPGRKVVVMGNASAAPAPGSAFYRVAAGADVVVTGAVASAAALQAHRAGAKVVGRVGVMGAEDAGRMAADLGTPCLMLGRFATNVHGRDVHQDDRLAAAAAVEARRALGARLAQQAGSSFNSAALGTRVEAVHDFWVQVMEKHDGTDPPLLQQA